jgi:hypothetical protein
LALVATAVAALAAEFLPMAPRAQTVLVAVAAEQHPLRQTVAERADLGLSL